MDNYKIANHLLSEGYSEDYMAEGLAEFLPNVVLAVTLGALGATAIKSALSNKDTWVSKLKDKISELASVKDENLNAVQSMRVKLSKALKTSNEFLHHAMTEVIKSGDADKVSKALAPKLKLNDEETDALKTYLVAVTHQIKTFKPLIDT